MAGFELQSALASEYDVECEEITAVDISSYQNYDLVIIGLSTWGEGEFNPSGEEFFAKLAEVKPDLSQTKFAVFGLGDSTYQLFCGAADRAAELLRSYGAQVLGKVHKIDGFMDEEKSKGLLEWAKSVC